VAGKVAGVDGIMISPQISGTAYVDTIEPYTSDGAITIDGLVISNGTIVTLVVEPAYLLIGDASSNAVAVPITGDISVGNTGLTAIASGVIVNADINATAAIALSKLASGTAAQVVVANDAGAPAYVSLSGDGSINTTGVFQASGYTTNWQFTASGTNWTVAITNGLIKNISP